MRGIDLGDLFAGRMSWRRFGVILRHLPPHSEYMTAVRNAVDRTDLPPPTPGVFGPWSQTDHLLARIGDLIEIGQWAQADPKSRGAMPKQYPRPGTESNVRPISEAALAYLEYKRAHRGADPPEGWVPAL